MFVKATTLFWSKHVSGCNFIHLQYREQNPLMGVKKIQEVYSVANYNVTIFRDGASITNYNVARKVKKSIANYAIFIVTL